MGKMGNKYMDTPILATGIYSRRPFFCGKDLAVTMLCPQRSSAHADL